MWELDCEEGWAPKNWCFWTVMLEKTLESPLDCKEIQPVHSEGDQPWDFFGRKDAKAETPVLWPPHAKSWLIGKDSDAGKDCGQKKGTTEDEMAGWHHWLDGRESEWTPGVGDGQVGLACCDSWGRKESDMTERLNNNKEDAVLSWIPFLRCHPENLHFVSKPRTHEEAACRCSHHWQLIASTKCKTQMNEPSETSSHWVTPYSSIPDEVSDILEQRQLLSLSSSYRWSAESVSWS